MTKLYRLNGIYCRYIKHEKKLRERPIQNILFLSLKVFFSAYPTESKPNISSIHMCKSFYGFFFYHYFPKIQIPDIFTFYKAPVPTFVHLLFITPVQAILVSPLFKTFGLYRIQAVPHLPNNQ